MPSGATTVDFGAFPGASDASVAVTGQAGILAASQVEAWIRCEASADHSADEHFVETIKAAAVSIVAGTGFTIRAMNTNQISEPVMQARDAPYSPGALAAGSGYFGGTGTRLYGVFNVSWAWV